MLAFLVLPLAALFLRAPLNDIVTRLQTPQVRQVVVLSFGTSVTTALVTVTLGTPVSYLLARYRFRLRGLLETITDLPIVLPPAVAGVALLIAFGRQGVIGSSLARLGITVGFTPVAVVMAQTFVSAPLYVRAAQIGFAAVGAEMEEAAQLDGASQWQIFRHLMVPVAWTALLGGCAMTWARAIGEFGATIIFAGNLAGRTQTMPLAIYLGFEFDLNAVLTLSVILVCASFFVLFVLRGFLKRQHVDSVA
jgi:molybdate transport system permease protein